MINNPTIDGVSREFVREGRYIVIKPDCEDSLRTERLRNYIEEMCFATPDCVVVEADWPEYEPVWKMIESRVTGKPTELDSAQATISHLRNDLDGTREHAADQRLKINSLQSTIAQLQARVQELESGRGEIIHQVSDGVSGWHDVELLKFTACQLDPEEYECRMLFTAPPAPVAVLLPERWVYQYFGPNPSPAGGYVDGWNACLDATAALNGGGNDRSRRTQG